MLDNDQHVRPDLMPSLIPDRTQYGTYMDVVDGRLTAPRRSRIWWRVRWALIHAILNPGGGRKRIGAGWLCIGAGVRRRSVP